MGRAARRAEQRRIPKALRNVPIVEISAQHLYEKLPGNKSGDIVKLTGFKRGPRGGLVRCEPGEETPVKLELRK